MKHIVIAVFIFCVVFVIVITVLSEVDNSLNRRLKDAVLGFVQEDVKELERLKIQKEQAQVRLKIQEIEDKQHAIPFYRRLKNYGSLAALLSLLIAILIMAVAFHKKLTVHILRIGKHSQIPIKHKDLSKLAPEISTGLVLAKQLEARAPEKAFQLYEKLSDVNVKQIQTLSGILEKKTHSMLPPEPPMRSQCPVPPFRDVLHDLYGSQTMCLGFKINNGEQISGTFRDIYSSFIAGSTGTGKTTWLGCVIAQAILVFDAEFQVLDPHYPDNESLLFLLGSLADLPHILFINDRQEHILPRLYTFNDRITARIEGEEAKTRPLILCVDELAYWMKTRFASAIGYIMERIALEGRKINVFLFASSQSTLASRTGKDSVMRDSLASSYVFKVKPRVANMLLQDKDSAKLVKEYCQDKGTALFSDTRGHHEVVKVPYATQTDMNTVFDLITDGNTVKKVHTLNKFHRDPRELSKVEMNKRQPEVQPDIEIDRFFNELTDTDNGNQHTEMASILTPERCKQQRELLGMSQAQLAEHADISLSKLKRYESENNKAEWDPDELNRICHVLFTQNSKNVIQFTPRKPVHD